MLAGHEELAAEFKPIRNGEIFWINNNRRFLAEQEGDTFRETGETERQRAKNDFPLFS